MGKLVIPKVTTTERNSITPDAGELLYDETSGQSYEGNGVTVGGVILGTGGSSTVPAPSASTGTNQLIQVNTAKTAYEFVDKPVSTLPVFATSPFVSQSVNENTTTIISAFSNLNTVYTPIIDSSTYSQTNTELTVLAAGRYKMTCNMVYSEGTENYNAELFVKATPPGGTAVNILKHSFRQSRGHDVSLLLVADLTINTVIEVSVVSGAGDFGSYFTGFTLVEKIG